MAKKPGKGQPTKYKQEYCSMLIGHMAQGYSFESFASVPGVCRDTIYEWAKVNPDFSDAKKIATELSRKFWEKQGIDGLWNEYQGRTLNTGVWIFNMRNRFGWTDKQEIAQTINQTTTHIIPELVDETVAAAIISAHGAKAKR